MSFISTPFLLFLPFVWLTYWLLKGHVHLQNIVLLLASYFFYSYFDWRMSLLIFYVSLLAYLTGLILERTTENRPRKHITVVSCVFIFLNLFIFKYYDFFVDNVNSLSLMLGLSCDLPTMRLILPIGISFYTFQAASYVLDVYRKKLCPTRSLSLFLLYISYFPQLVAGPIERASDMLPQLSSPRTCSYEMLVDGARQALWGYVKKMVVADNCALAVNLIWNNYSEMSGLTLLAGVVLFSFQIYADFSGYSDIAIGISKMLGISLTQNFNYPYFSTSVSSFWRRWHITLMNFFRDYVYIPMGGNRRGRWRTVCNTFLVFSVSGLWHGANWTFIIWGLFHAVLLLPHILFPKIKLHLPSFYKMSAVFALVSLGWIVFRAPTLSDALAYMGGLNMRGSIDIGKISLLYCLGLIVIEYIQRDKSHVLQFDANGWQRHHFVRVGIYFILVMMIFFLHGEDQTFIYFQF